MKPRSNIAALRRMVDDPKPMVMRFTIMGLLDDLAQAQAEIILLEGVVKRLTPVRDGEWHQ